MWCALGVCMWYALGGVCMRSVYVVCIGRGVYEECVCMHWEGCVGGVCMWCALGGVYVVCIGRGACL